MQGLGQPLFLGQADSHHLLGDSPSCPHLSPLHQALHPELCPSHGSRSISLPGQRRPTHCWRGHPRINSALGGEISACSPPTTGAVHDSSLETLHLPCPKGYSKGRRGLPSLNEQLQGMLLLAALRRLISSHGDTAGAALKARTAQEAKESESQMGPNPDEERQPHE